MMYRRHTYTDDIDILVVDDDMYAYIRDQAYIVIELHNDKMRYINCKPVSEQEELYIRLKYL